MKLEIGNAEHIKWLNELRRRAAIDELRAVLDVRCPECGTSADSWPWYDAKEDRLVWDCTATIECECSECGHEHERDCEGEMTTEIPDEYRGLFAAAETNGRQLCLN